MPASHIRLRPTETEVQAAVEEETKRLRILRLQQVRGQARELSTVRRHRVECAKGAELQQLRHKVEQQCHQQQQQRLASLQQQVQIAAQEMGSAHRAAQQQIAANAAEAVKRQQAEQRALERGKQALKLERKARLALKSGHEQNANTRQAVMLREKERARRVALQPTPAALLPRSPSPPPAPAPVLVQEAGTLATTHYRPSNATVTRHQVGSEQDARLAAERERARLQQLREREDEERREREARAEERGMRAEERERLLELRERLTAAMPGEHLEAFLEGADNSEYSNIQTPEPTHPSHNPHRQPTYYTHSRADGSSASLSDPHSRPHRGHEERESCLREALGTIAEFSRNTDTDDERNMSRAALDDRQRRVLERQSLAEDRGSTTHNPSSDTSSLTQSNRQQLLEQRVLDLLRKQRELESDSSSEYSTLLQEVDPLTSDYVVGGISGTAVASDGVGGPVNDHNGILGSSSGSSSNSPVFDAAAALVEADNIMLLVRQLKARQQENDSDVTNDTDQQQSRIVNTQHDERQQTISATSASDWDTISSGEGTGVMEVTNDKYYSNNKLRKGTNSVVSKNIENNYEEPRNVSQAPYKGRASGNSATDGRHVLLHDNYTRDHGRAVSADELQFPRQCEDTEDRENSSVEQQKNVNYNRMPYTGGHHSNGSITDSNGNVTSSFEEEIRIRLMLEDASSDDRHNDDNSEVPSDLSTSQIHLSSVANVNDNNSKGSLIRTNNDSSQFTRDMEYYLGMEHHSSPDFLNPPQSSCSSIEFPQQVFDNLRQLKRNRENIQTKLSKFKGFRNSTPVVHGQNIFKSSQGPVTTVMGKASLQTSIRPIIRNPSNVNYSPEVNTNDQTTLDEPFQFYSQNNNNNNQPTSDDRVTVPPQARIYSSSSSGRDQPVSSSIQPIANTPVRIYTEKVKQDGTGRRPLRRRDKFELQKKLVLQNYIKRLLDTKQCNVDQISQSTIDGSSIELSSVRVLNKLLENDESVSITNGSSDVFPSSAGQDSSDSNMIFSDKADLVPGRSAGTHDCDLDRVPSRLSDLEENGSSYRNVLLQDNISGLSSDNTDGQDVQHDLGDPQQSKRISPISTLANSDCCIRSEKISVSKLAPQDGEPEAITQYLNPSSSNSSIYEEVVTDFVDKGQENDRLKISIPVSTPFFSAHEITDSSSSISIPSFPSTSTPTVVSSSILPTGRVSRYVSPIVSAEDQNNRQHNPSNLLRNKVTKQTESPNSGFQAAVNARKSNELQQETSSVVMEEEPVPGYTKTSIQPSSSTSYRTVDVLLSTPPYLGNSSLEEISSLVTCSGGNYSACITDSETTINTLQTQEEIIQRQQEIYRRLEQLNDIKTRFLLNQQRQTKNSEDTRRSSNPPTKSEPINEATKHFSQHQPSSTNQRYPNLSSTQQEPQSSLIKNHHQASTPPHPVTTSPPTPLSTYTYEDITSLSSLCVSSSHGLPPPPPQLSSDGQWTTTSVESGSIQQWQQSSALIDSDAFEQSEAEAPLSQHLIECSESATSLDLTELEAEVTDTSQFVSVAEEAVRPQSLRAVGHACAVDSNHESGCGDVNLYYSQESVNSSLQSLNSSPRSAANESLRKIMEIVDIKKLSGIRVLPNKTDRTTIPKHDELPSNAIRVPVHRQKPLNPTILEKTNKVVMSKSESNDGTSSCSLNSTEIGLFSSREWSKASNTTTEDEDRTTALQAKLAEIQSLLRTANTGVNRLPSDITGTTKSAAEVLTANATTSGTVVRDTIVSADSRSATIASNDPSPNIVTSRPESSDQASSSSSNFDEVLKNFGWARGMLKRMDKLDEDYPSTDSSIV